MPPIVVTLMAVFRDFFTAPVFDHVLVLVIGAVLTPGKRTVSAVLRIMGLADAADFALYHHVLSQARWDSRAIARKLLTMILERFLPAGALIIGIDDTVERRWGRKIAARGIYRDPVRSSHGHFVKASGLRWLAFMAMIPLPLARRRWALPFLTILAPSQRYDDTRGKRHKSLVDWARQGILEALKARHLLYRLMLWYFLWMAKLSEKAQWAVVIVCAFALGVGYGAFQSVSQALSMVVLPSPANAGRDLGIINIASAVPQVIGAPIAGLVVAGAGGYRGLFVFAGLLAVGAAVVFSRVPSSSDIAPSGAAPSGA